MKKKILLVFVLITLCMLAFWAISASAATEGIYTYSVSGGEAIITKCNASASGEIIIPSTLGGYPITSIGSDAFSGCTGLTSVSIPDSVTSIGNDAFSRCTGLTKVDITDLEAWCRIEFGNIVSNPLYYGKNLYLNGSLVTNLIIPEGVTSMENYAFYACTGLTSITIPDSVTSIGGSAFGGCTGLISVTIPDSVTSIGGSAFGGCTSLTSVTIPDSVTSIGNYAFSGCTGLTSITIGDSVTSI